MSKYFMSWMDLNGVEKAAILVTIVGLSGGVALIFLRHFIIASVVVEFVLLGKAEKRREKDD